MPKLYDIDQRNKQIANRNNKQTKRNPTNKKETNIVGI